MPNVQATRSPAPQSARHHTGRTGARQRVPAWRQWQPQFNRRYFSLTLMIWSLEIGPMAFLDPDLTVNRTRRFMPSRCRPSPGRAGYRKFAWWACYGYSRYSCYRCRRFARFSSRCSSSTFGSAFLRMSAARVIGRSRRAARGLPVPPCAVRPAPSARPKSSSSVTAGSSASRSRVVPVPYC